MMSFSVSVVSSCWLQPICSDLNRIPLAFCWHARLHNYRNALHMRFRDAVHGGARVAKHFLLAPWLMAVCG
jgi:hypothetical protein